MQWLINIIKAWIKTQGYLTTSFIDRGDPAPIDFDVGDFIQDNVWRDLDLSGIVPANAKAVLLTLTGRATSIAEYLLLKKKGNVNDSNVSRIDTPVANVRISGDLSCPLDENRFIQYKGRYGTFNIINFTVKGWWL